MQSDDVMAVSGPCYDMYCFLMHSVLQCYAVFKVIHVMATWQIQTAYPSTECLLMPLPGVIQTDFAFGGEGNVCNQKSVEVPISH